MFRGWDIGDGLFLPYNKLSIGVSKWVGLCYFCVYHSCILSRTICLHNNFIYVSMFQTVTISSLEKFRPSALVTYSSSSKKTVSVSSSTESDVEANQSIVSIPRLFECSEDACVCVFMKFGNLLRHFAVGGHRRLLEKSNLLDTAKKTYQSKLATADNKRLVSLSLEQASFDPADFDELPEIGKGWALPIARKSVRFTDKQRQYLNVSNSSV